MLEPSTRPTLRATGAHAYAEPGVTVRPRLRRRRVVTIVLVLLLVVILGASGLIIGYRSALRLPLFNANGQRQNGPAAGPPIVGHVYFESSGQVSLQSDAGIADQVQLDFSQLAPPPPGQRYYAWLVTGSIEGKAILLGSLSVSHGKATLWYPGDAQHTNLLATVNRFLITEEGAMASPPVVPTPDRAAWRYAASFSQAPNPAENPPYSLLDHLHHLLSSDPILDDPGIGLYGGLDIWLFRDGQKILEWAGSARDAWGKGPAQDALIHRQLVRVLEYLDGWRYALQELPPGTPLLVDSRIALVAMREQTVNQEPPGLLYHVGQHLTGVAEAPAASQDQRRLAAQQALALARVSGLYDQVRREALALVTLSPDQLEQPAQLARLELLATQARDAFSGTEDPVTGQVVDGITQIHYAMSNLATMDVVPVACPTGNLPPAQASLCL